MKAQQAVFVALAAAGTLAAVPAAEPGSRAKEGFLTLP